MPRWQAGFFMRYGLRTLMAISGAVPPVIGGLYWACESEEVRLVLGAMAVFAGTILVAGIIIFRASPSNT
jgi:hypothetical protein